jgi:hypothetical protein
MSQRVRNFLIVLAGLVLLGGVVGFIDGKAEKAERTAPAPKPLAVPAKPAKIYRMEAALEELRKFPAIDGMERADDAARQALPRGVETAGEWVRPEDVLEGYAHPNGKRFFVIMKPGDRAYSVFLD